MATWNTGMPSSIAVGFLVSPANYLNPVLDNINYNRSPLVESNLNTADFSTTSTSFTDVTGCEDTIETTGETLRIQVTGSFKSGNVGAEARLNLEIDGSLVTADGQGLAHTTDVQQYAFTLVHTVIGLTPGSHTVKLQLSTSNASYTAQIYNPSMQLVDAA